MSHRLEGVFILVICLFGFAWQTMESIRDYLNYPVYTQMNSIPFGNESHMGAVAVCVPYSRLNGSAYANQTILQVRSNVFTVHDVVESCLITLPNLTRASCFDVSRVRTYTDPMCQCFAFFELRDLKVPPSVLMYQVTGHLDADLVKFKLKVPSVIDYPGAQFWAVKLYKEYERLTLKRGDHSKKWFLPETYNKLDFSFDRWSSNFLPVPYQSRCFPYHKTKYLTRYNAIDHCIVENFNTSTGQKLWPPFVYASAGEYDEHEMDRYAPYNEQERRYLMGAIRLCHAKFPYVDCRQRIYGLDIKSYQYTNQPFKGVEAIIEFFPPTRMHIGTTADMSLMDQVNSIGGIVSIWLGVSVFMPIISISEILLTGIKSLLQEKEQEEEGQKIRRISGLRRNHRNPSTDSRNRLLPLQSNQSPSTPSASRGRLVKGLETVAFLMCVAGCIFQVYDVIMIYIDKPFTSVYVTRPPELITMPRLTICSERRINESKLKDKYPKVYADLIDRNVSRSDWPFELTIHQLFNTTRESSEIIDMKKSKFASGPNLDLVPISDHFTTRRMINYKYVCLRTLSPNTVKDKAYPTYQRDILDVPKWADIVIRFDDISDEIDLYMHYETDFHQEPGSLEKHVVRLNHNTSLKLRQTIYFKRTRRILYENHFTSRCINYLKTWGFSKATMIQKCSSQRMIDRFNELPMDNFINKTIPAGVRFTRNETRVQEFIEQCNRKFDLHDCDELFIETKVETNHVILSGGGRYTQDLDNKSMNIIIYPPGTGYLEIVQVLRYSLIELFAFCGGVIGAWLGLSFLHAKNSLHQAVCYFRCP